MTVDIAIVFGLLAVTIVLFVSDQLRLDVVALMSLLALALTGILTPAEALAGFSDPVVLMIAGLFIVGEGLFQTGAADALGRWLGRVGGSSETRLLVVVMLLVGVLSAFMSSTGTVAVFLPVVVSLARRSRIAPSRLLIPLAYASLLGGMLTLIGTPPNIVVSNQLANAGLAPFNFFAFTPIGVVMLVLGTAAMALFGRRLLPDRRDTADDSDASEQLCLADLDADYGISDHLAWLRVGPQSPLAGKTLAEANLRAGYHINVLELQRWPAAATAPLQPQPVTPDTRIQTKDVLTIQSLNGVLESLAAEQNLQLLPSLNGQSLHSEQLGMVEVLLTPRSRLIGKTLQESRFRDLYNVTVLGVKRMNEPIDDEIATIPLRFGDTLLVHGTWDNIALLQNEQRNFVVVGAPREMGESHGLTPRAPFAIAIMLGMLLLMTLEIVPAVIAVLLAATAMVLTRCLSMNDAYRGMNWESVVLIAGMLPMATALQKTGGVALISNTLTATLGGWGPMAVMAGLFALTSLLTQFISNTATAVLIAPIALAAATSLGVSPYPLLMAVSIAASTSFATPIASPVNTLVLGPGNYRFGDFARIGLLLQLIIMIAALAIVPLVFPL